MAMESMVWDTVHDSQQLEAERRSKPRIAGSYPARVQGCDINGREFSVQCCVENISASGVYVKCGEDLSEGSKVSLRVYLAVNRDTGSTVEAHGRVVRIETSSDGHHGLGIAIDRHKFL